MLTAENFFFLYPLPVIALPPRENVGVLSLPRAVDVALDAVKALLVDDRAHEGVELGDGADLKGLLLLNEAFLDLGRKKGCDLTSVVMRGLNSSLSKPPNWNLM